MIAHLVRQLFAPWHGFVQAYLSDLLLSPLPMHLAPYACGPTLGHDTAAVTRLPLLLHLQIFLRPLGILCLLQDMQMILRRSCLMPCPQD